ncbi:MAG: FecR domain-containing protein [Opitutales bacterium]
MNDQDKQNLLDLADAHIDGRLSAEEHERLEATLSASKEARRLFLDYMHDHAALAQEFVHGGEMLEFSLDELEESPARGTWVWKAAASIAILFSLGLGAFWGSSQSEGGTFAFIESNNSAQWSSSDLPTSIEARLGRGSMRLEEGLAVLRFDSGVLVSLEAPAHIELLDPMNVNLLGGTVVVEVPDGVSGFTVETMAASVVDYGTQFAVNVDPRTMETSTMVLEGDVEVKHHSTGTSIQLETREFSTASIESISQESEWSEFGPSNSRSQDIVLENAWVTAPLVEDSYIFSAFWRNRSSEALLLVKNGIEERDGKEFSRKAYMSFDLSQIGGGEIEDAEIVLNFAPTGWGLASFVPDATFVVYGVSDDTGAWSHGALSWDSAPGNDFSSGGTMDPALSRELLRFEVPQGVTHGNFIMRDPKLPEWLRKQDGTITFVVVRETEETRQGGLIHGIASSRHPSLPGPTLRVKISD